MHQQFPPNIQFDGFTSSCSSHVAHTKNHSITAGTSSRHNDTFYKKNSREQKNCSKINYFSASWKGGIIVVSVSQQSVLFSSYSLLKVYGYTNHFLHTMQFGFVPFNSVAQLQCSQELQEDGEDVTKCYLVLLS